MDTKTWANTRKWIYRGGCLLAATTVTIAALGGHKYEWSAHKKHLFADALKYSMFNSVGIIISSFRSETLLPVGLFVGGTLGFCAPIWYKCFTDSNPFGKIMPLGGLALIGAWIALAFA